MKIGDLVRHKPTGDMGMVVRMETSRLPHPPDRVWVYVSWIGNSVVCLNHGQLSGYPKADLEIFNEGR